MARSFPGSSRAAKRAGNAKSVRRDANDTGHGEERLRTHCCGACDFTLLIYEYDREKRNCDGTTRASHLFDNTKLQGCAAPHRPVLQIASCIHTLPRTGLLPPAGGHRRAPHERGRASRPSSRASLGERRRAASPKSILRATALPRIGQGCIAHVLFVPFFRVAHHRRWTLWFLRGCTLPR